MRNLLLAFLLLLTTATFSFAAGNDYLVTIEKSSLLSFKRLASGTTINCIDDFCFATTDKNTAQKLYDQGVAQSIGENPRRYFQAINDPKFSSQWHLDNSAWQNSTDLLDNTSLSNTYIFNETPVVAVLDSGVAYQHPDLKDFLIPGYDFGDNDADTTDTHGHGTHVAGIIAATTNNGVGVAGVSYNQAAKPRVRVLPLKVSQGLNDDMFLGDILLAIKNVCDRHDAGERVDVVNMSFGAYSYNHSEYRAIESLKNRGIIVVAAAGNDTNNNSRMPMYPASYHLDNIIPVASLDDNGGLSYFSNYGSNVRIAAPGGDILSIGNDVDMTDISSRINYADEIKEWTVSGDNYTLNFPGPLAGIDSNKVMIDFFTLNYRYQAINVKLHGNLTQTAPRLVNKASLTLKFTDNSSSVSRGYEEVIYAPGGSGGGGILRDLTLSIPRVSNLIIEFFATNDYTDAISNVTVDEITYYASHNADGYAFMSGTSMAAPVVAGTIALGLSIKPNGTATPLTRQQMVHHIYGTAEKKSSLATKVSQGQVLDIYNFVDTTLKCYSTDFNSNTAEIKTYCNKLRSETAFPALNPKDDNNNSSDDNNSFGCSIFGATSDKADFLLIMLPMAILARFYIRKNSKVS